MKKTIASYFDKELGRWIPQQDIDMHPLEEEQFLSDWAIHNVKMKCPPKPSKEEEYEWLIQFGADYVKQKRIEWEALNDAIQPELKAAEEKFAQCTHAWNDHFNLCKANKLNPNTFEGDAREKLSMPIEVS